MTHTIDSKGESSQTFVEKEVNVREVHSFHNRLQRIQQKLKALLSSELTELKTLFKY
jgi:hypothetical protein